MPTFTEFVSLLSQRYGIAEEAIIEGDSFGMIGLDSLSLFSLIEELEDRYNIEIDTNDITKIDTVKKMYDYMAYKMNSIEHIDPEVRV